MWVEDSKFDVEKFVWSKLVPALRSPRSNWTTKNMKTHPRGMEWITLAKKSIKEMVEPCIERYHVEVDQ